MKFIVALLGSKMGFKQDYSTMLGITDEFVDEDGIPWCTFDWGYGAYSRDRLVFLRAVDFDENEGLSVAGVVERFLPNLVRSTLVDSAAAVEQFVH